MPYTKTVSLCFVSFQLSITLFLGNLIPLGEFINLFLLCIFVKYMKIKHYFAYEFFSTLLLLLSKDFAVIPTISINFFNTPLLFIIVSFAFLPIPFIVNLLLQKLHFYNRIEVIKNCH